MSDDRVICIDIGYSKIVAALVDTDINNQLEVLAVSEVPSKGLYRGKVKEIEAVSESIRGAIDGVFENVESPQVDRVIVGVTGMEIEGVNTKGVSHLNGNNKIITQREINEAIDHAKALAFPLDRQVFLVAQQQFIIDGKITSTNPIKMGGDHTLEAQVHVLTCLENVKENFERCLMDAGIDRFQIFYSGITGADAILTDEEKNLGCLYIDLGKDTIDVLFFKNRSLQYSKVYSSGCNQITNDLCFMFQFTFEDAERFKREGNAYSLHGQEDREIVIPNLGGIKHRICSYKEINETLDARVYEILSTIAKDFQNFYSLDELKYGIVLTGGGAQQTGLDMWARKIFDTHVRIASPEKINGFKGEYLQPNYSSLYGLIHANKSSGQAFRGSETRRYRPRDYKSAIGRLKTKILDWYRSFF